MNNCDLKEAQNLWLEKIIANGIILANKQPSAYGYYFYSCGRTFFALIRSAGVIMVTNRDWIDLGSSDKILNLIWKANAESKKQDTQQHCDYLIRALNEQPKTRKWWEFWK